MLAFSLSPTTSPTLNRAGLVWAVMLLYGGFGNRAVVFWWQPPPQPPVCHPVFPLSPFQSPLSDSSSLRGGLAVSESRTSSSSSRPCQPVPPAAMPAAFHAHGEQECYPMWCFPLVLNTKRCIQSIALKSSFKHSKATNLALNANAHLQQHSKENAIRLSYVCF